MKIMFTLRFKAVQSQLKNKEGKKLYFPRLVKRGKTATLRELAEILSRESTLSKGDIYNVVQNLDWGFKTLLMDGRSLTLDGLGTFNVVLRSKYGVETPEKVNANQIKSLRIRFTPEGTRTPMDGLTRSMFQGISFERIDSKGNIVQDGGNSDDDDDDFVDPTL